MALRETDRQEPVRESIASEGKGGTMDQTSEVTRRRVFATITWVLLAVLGYAAVKTAVVMSGGKEVFAPSTISGAESERRADVASGQLKPGQDYSAIFERDLFGSPTLSLEEEEQPEAHDDSDAKGSDTKEVDIALLGTVAGSREVSRAVIEDLKTSALSLVKVGDSVGNASIESIEKDAVVLLDAGQRKTVRLQAGQSKADEAGGVHPVVAAGPVGTRQPVPQDKAPATMGEKLRRSAMMLPKASVKPYRVAGRTEGLQITSVENVESLKDLGLKDGDVILSVNGHRLTSKQEAYQISRKARSLDSVNVELMRGNRSRALCVPLN